MKKSQVPQDDGSLASKNMQELCYAVDERGEYTTVSSSGWEPKTLALNASLEMIAERIAQAKAGVIAGELSPIAYYMELNRMDLPLLAKYIGIHKWFVKRHFQTKRFARLSPKLLDRYASTFNISVETLRNPFMEPATDTEEGK